MRNKICKFIYKKLGFKDGELLPRWCLIFRFLFFPIKTLNYLFVSCNKYLLYDFSSHCLIIKNEKISIEALDFLIESINKNKKMMICKEHGQILIKRIEE